MSSLRVAALQIDLKWHDPAANKQHIEEVLRAQNPQADIIVLPEMFTTGFSMDAEGQAEQAGGPTLAWMNDLAKSYQALIVGSLIIHQENSYFNRLLAVDANGLVSAYNKRHLFRMANEHEVYTPGEEKVIFEYKGWRICPQICYDLRFPVWSRNPVNETGYGYDLLLYVANWPATRASHWVNLLQARAIENQAYVIGVNRVGTDGNKLPYSGNSIIADYMGEKMAYLEHKEGILQAELTLDNMANWRKKFPIWRDADTFHVDQATTFVV